MSDLRGGMQRNGDRLLRRVERMGAAIDPALSDRDVERLIAGARRLRRRRVAVRVTLGALAAGAGALAIAWRLGAGPASPPAVAERPAAVAPASAPVTPPEGRPLRFSDGSLAVPLDAGTVLAVREASPERTAVELGRGRGRFEVARRPERSFTVRAGDVSVTVIGTVFTVERVADRVGVAVERGRVRVDWRSGSRHLDAGDSGWFPPLVVGAREASTAPRPRPIATRGARARASAKANASGELVEPAVSAAPAASVAPVASVDRVDSSSAMDAPTDAPMAAPVAVPATVAPGDREPSRAARETAESLLSAADRARQDGRSSEGAALLRRVLARHRSDPRAPLAAFTLGRVLLVDLRRPAEAAAAFAEARALAPKGPFAEDALAREAESWAAAGDPAAARDRAREYLRRYPQGRRLSTVRAFAGDAE